MLPPINIEKHTVHAIDRAFVVPPIHRIGNVPGVVVTWQNTTNAKARLWFPNGDQVFDPNPAAGILNFSNPIDIPARSSLALTIKNPPPADGFYKYSVYSEEVKDHAQGNSEPVLSVP